MWEAFTEWFLSLGKDYGVNPYIFGGIYVGAIPLFSLCIAWLVRNYRKGKSIVFPAFAATFFFLSAYIYLIIVGMNVPIWVYIAVVALVIFGAYSTLKKVRRQISEVDAEKADQGESS